MTIYSSTIQNVLFKIPYAMLILGGSILFSYGFAISDKPFTFHDALTKEDILLFYFMVHVFIAGLLFAPDRNGHVSQWVTCLEYLFIQAVIASIIKRSGTNTFHMLLLANAILLAGIFLRNPINYLGTGRYSISEEVNPNGLGLGFVAGIWAALYRQSDKKQPLIITSIFVVLFGYCIFLTGSRKSLIGAGLAVVLWLLFCFFPSLKKKNTWGGLLSFGALLVFVIIIAWIFLDMYANSTIATRMGDLFYEASEGKRSDMYREGYELVKRNPIFGIGFQGFKFYFGKYSHATIVEIPVSGGVIGTILYFGAYLISLRRIICIFKKTKGINSFESEHWKAKMLLVLWIVLVFFTVCIIHPYQFDSSINFGILFGGSAYIERGLDFQNKPYEKKRIGSKYIKYE